MPRQHYKQRSLKAAQRYIGLHIPELGERPLRIHVLDGPPDAPRYAVTAEACSVRVCPRGFEVAGATGQCPVLDCPLRRSARLLLDRGGKVLHTTMSGIHWN